MSHSSLRKHRHFHSKALIKAAVQPSANTPLSPSPTPRAASTTSMPSPPSTVLKTQTAITVDHAPAPTMQPAIPHNIFALPSTSPAQLPPHTILAILLLVIVFTTATIWTLLVCLIHYRGTTTGGKSTHAAHTRPLSPSPPPSTRGRAWLRNPFQRARSSTYKYEALQLRSFIGDDDASPLNPFLVAPGRDSLELVRGGSRRGEEEWALRHRAFFGVEGGENRPASLLGAGEGRGTDEVQDGAALLAGAAGSVVFGGGESAWRGGWVDWGLAAVDGLVDRLTARIVRWTDEGELVLPISEG